MTLAALAPIGGPLISAGATLLGSKMTADANNKASRLNAIAAANEAERAWQRTQESEANARKYNYELMLTNQAREDARLAQTDAMQREFAKMGVQWRVQDARAAGIHPMAALGLQGPSYSSSVGSVGGSSASSHTYPITGAKPFAGDSAGAGVAAMGQDLSRALQATRPDDERAIAFNKTVQDLTVQKMGMENAILASQLARVNQTGSPPNFPSSRRKNMVDGQGNTPSRSTKTVNMKKMDVVHSGSSPVIEPKPVSEVGHTQSKNSPSGRYSPVFSEQAKERLEEDAIGALQWTWRNRIIPMMSQGNMNPPDVPLKQGKKWYFHPLTWEYMQVKKPKPGPDIRIYGQH